MYNLTKEEEKILKKLNTPRKIQDFLNQLPVNFEEGGDTCFSPRKVLREKRAHCIEGAILAYLCFQLAEKKAWLVDLKTTKDDFEHVLCLFREKGKYGAVSKTNHYCLRYREPVYSNVRELVMSCFHEYFNDSGKKTLRSFSKPVTLGRFGKEWVTKEGDLWEINDWLDQVKHFSILNEGQARNLRKADQIEIKVGRTVEWEQRN